MSGTLRLRGATSGYSELQAPAVAADQTFVLPTAGGTLLTTDSPVPKLTLELGSASQPSLTFEGDTDTGLYSSGTNTLNLVTGGSDRLVIDSSGNVMIGTTSAAQYSQLTVRAASPQLSLYATPGQVSCLNMGDTDDNDIGQVAYSNSDNSMQFITNADEQMRIDSSGNVGINTLNPNQRLNVFGNAEFNAYDNTSGGGGYYAPKGLIIGNAFDAGKSVGDDRNGIIWQERGLDLVFGTNDAERMRIDSSGRILIGTTTEGNADADALTISSTGGYTGITLRSDTNQGAALYFSDATSGSGEYDGYITYSQSNQSMSFGTAGNGTARMLIDSAGNVGIGTTSPGSFNSDGRNLVVGTGSGGQGMSIYSGTSNYGTLYFADGTTGDALYRGAVLYNHSSDFMRFDVAASERMRIDYNGHVGIGKTPVDTNGFTRALDLSGTTGSALYLRNAAGSTNYGYVGYYNSDLYFTNIVSGGNVRFYNGGDERMRIDSSGRVGIGTSDFAATSPYADNLVVKDATDAGITIQGASSSSEHSSLYLGDTTANRGWLEQTLGGGASSTLTIGTAGITRFYNNGGERMRIDSNGDVHIGKTAFTSHNTDGHTFNNSGWAHHCTTNLAALYLNRNNSNGNIAEFYVSNSYIGNINYDGTTCTYNSVSDYRLKENIVDIADGISRVKQLSPRRFNFISNPDTTVDGFIAHEAQSVVPEAVCGEKDGEQMQGIDQSKLVPLLTAALQEAIAKIETLETKVAALEAQ